LIIGAADPAATRVYWAYKSQAGTAGLFDKVICYDYALDRASTIQISGEYLASLAKPGLTLENMDALAPGIITISGAANNGSGAIRLTVSGLTAGTGTSNTTLNVENSVTVYGITGTTEANGTWPFTIVDSTHIDLIGSTFTHAYVSGGSIGGSLDQLSFSLDDISTAALSQLSAVNGANMLGFFSGSNLAATIDTAEQVLPPMSGSGRGTVRRARVKGFRPVTDAAVVSGAVGARENVQSAVAYSAAQGVNAQGLCPANVSTRLARARVTIPYGTAWSFATGVEPDFAQEGRR
jgi:hypothetical protein